MCDDLLVCSIKLFLKADNLIVQIPGEGEPSPGILLYVGELLGDGWALKWQPRLDLESS